MKDKPEKEKKRFSWTYLIPIAAAIVIAVNAVLLVRGIWERKQADADYETLVADTVTFPAEDAGEEQTLADTEEEDEEADTASSAQEEITYPALSIDHAALKKINSDYVFFLYIPVLDCAYPVVHSSDNTEYLTTDFSGNHSVDGSIFLDCYTSEDLSDGNSFILGHNMRSGSMFGCLRRFYQEEGLCDKDPYFYLYTDGEVRKYRIFGYAQVKDDDPLYDTATDYESDAGYDAFIDRVRGMSIYDVDASGVDFSQRPKVVTLSTCYGNGATRFVVFGALVGTAKT
ncbi:MAG: class B sortase [Lachnospiraceae bacterium]